MLEMKDEGFDALLHLQVGRGITSSFAYEIREPGIRLL
jgi:hypothetical protein